MFTAPAHGLSALGSSAPSLSVQGPCPPSPCPPSLGGRVETIILCVEVVQEGWQRAAFFVVRLLPGLSDHILDDVSPSNPPVAQEGLHDRLQELMGDEGRLL